MPPQPATLAPGEQIICTATYTLTQADLDGGSRRTRPRADSTETAPRSTATETVPLPQAPALTLARRACSTRRSSAPATAPTSATWSPTR